MKACASFGALALLVGLIGCAAVPQYPNKVPADTACIVGDAPSYLSSASDGQATVEIREIDGAPVGAYASRCVPPGIHRLGVSAVYNRQAVQDYVELGLDGGRQYRLRANLRGISFVFQLIDVTATPAINVAQFSLKADYAPESCRSRSTSTTPRTRDTPYGAGTLVTAGIPGPTTGTGDTGTVGGRPIGMMAVILARRQAPAWSTMRRQRAAIPP